MNHGLLLPFPIYTHILEGSHICETDRVPLDTTACKMHYVPGHYVLSYQFMKTITIYDSSYSEGRIEQIMPQLKIVYKSLTENPNTPLHYCSPGHQRDSESCGIFIIAFAVALLLQQIPLQRTEFLTASMRRHLLLCLEQGSFRMFPTVANDMQRLQS